MSSYYKKMKIKKITDKSILESHFRKNIPLNIYQLGDLDDFFFEYTEWFGLFESEESIEPIEIALLYKGSELPVLLAFCNGDTYQMKILIEKIKDDLPKDFYAHLSPGLKDVLVKDHSYEPGGRYLKMYLTQEKMEDRLMDNSDNNVRRLNVSDLDDILKFYKKSYPDNWFDKRMLETGKYFGYFHNANPVGISGIHVYSKEYKVAALGNITTDSEYRGKSICTKVTSALCTDLFKTVDVIGLNVSESNAAAIRCYEKIGFKVYGEFEECMFRNAHSPQRHQDTKNSRKSE